MDRKNKVWRIVLVALLLLAIIALLFFNSKLNASREALSTATAQLAAEQESSAALQAELDAAEDQVRRLLQALRIPVDHQKIHVCLCQSLYDGQSERIQTDDDKCLFFHFFLFSLCARILILR